MRAERRDALNIPIIKLGNPDFSQIFNEKCHSSFVCFYNQRRNVNKINLLVKQ